MDHFSENIQLLQCAIESLPPKEQEAVQWLIANYDIAISICKEKPLTASQRKQFMKNAVQKDDMHLLVLLLLERIVNS